MDHKDNIYTVNLFRPKKGHMTEEVIIIFTALFGWGVMTFGFQIFVWLMSGSSGLGRMLTRFQFFNLPFHFWFTAQLLPLWFVILCFIFNVYIDRLTERHSRRRDRTYE
jgi:putative solute:sodium symporter small subunit